ncbi:iron-sulfur cluster assembly accessory protein [Salinisphaera sp. Q1T1-3]|uniref:HesB/IscA family protein n=1 Tax=Salinisphaera sp. Q1T1-3 TaxID=2321229 RepID=UPI000E724D74|nr:iron-sulfur cluster assembly accessory protein [Salinisphaera sp. Q1T1-3]RJS92329.1 iron-sulfur cluster assembly accessory protein [Salinisphaera sp. Q1T1-3]
MSETTEDIASQTAGLSITTAAAERIRHQLEKRGHGLGLRLGVRKSGCSGYMYTMDYADEVEAEDDVFEHDGAKVVVAHKHMDVLAGTTVDFRSEGLNRMFRFDNPRAKNACGCGESFMV